MMKYTGGLALGLGLFLGLPAFTFGGGMPDSLEAALADTMKALEVLGKVQGDLQAGNPVVRGLVEGLTEPPSGTAPGREQALGKLRDEVSGLQAQLDARRLQEGIPATGRTTGQGPGVGGSTGGVTTGLSRTFVRAMGQGDPTGGAQPGSGGASTGAPQDPKTDGARAGESKPDPTASGESSASADHAPRTGEPGPSPEGKGYSANPLRQAQACFRAGRYQQGLDVLEAVTPFTEGDYWRAKLLDRLGRTDEALELFRAVEVAEDAGPLAAAAKRDAEFAVWRAEFEKKAEEDSK